MESIIELVNHFAATHQGDGVTKSSGEEMKVLTHEVKTYSFDLSEELKNSTSSRSVDAAVNRVDLYTMTFEKDGKQMIVPDSPLLLYIPNRYHSTGEYIYK